MIQLEYEVKEAGWAIGKINNEKKEHQFSISYFRDSLKELAESAIQIRNKTKSVVFVEEPGEYALILNKISETEIEYEFRHYSEIESFEFNTQSNFELIMEGKTTITKYINQVRKILNQIFTEIGTEEYFRRWKKHEFPHSEYRLLK